MMAGQKLAFADGRRSAPGTYSPHLHTSINSADKHSIRLARLQDIHGKSFMKNNDNDVDVVHI